MQTHRPLPTIEVIRLLQESNPNRQVTEHLIRSAIRRGLVPTPLQISGCYLWNRKDIRRLAAKLRLSDGRGRSVKSQTTLCAKPPSTETRHGREQGEPARDAQEPDGGLGRQRAR